MESQFHRLILPCQWTLCVCVLWVYVTRYLHMCACRGHSLELVFLNDFSSYFSESLMNLELTDWARLMSSRDLLFFVLPQNIPSLFWTNVPRFYVSARDLNVCPHVFRTNPLSTELSSQPKWTFCIMKIKILPICLYL